MSMSNFLNNAGQIPCALTTCSGGGGGGGVNSISQGNGIIVTEPTTGNYQIINGGVVTLIEGSGIDITPGNPGEFTITNIGVGAVTGLTQGSGIVIAETNPNSGNYTITNGGVLSILEGTGITITENPPAGSQAFTISTTGGSSFPPGYGFFQSVTTQPIIEGFPEPFTAYTITYDTQAFLQNISETGGIITLINAGIYRITATATISGTTGNNLHSNLWLVSGTGEALYNVSGSNAMCEVDNGHIQRLTYDITFQAPSPNTNIAFNFSCDDSYCQIVPIPIPAIPSPPPPTAPQPDTPSIQVIVQRVA